ncbi:hypothetical protein ZWY2020_021130 [Hordeum vulgare]|nr:hypothetical protein ZWY2020_021130 [Hordeum vulgare]
MAIKYLHFAGAGYAAYVLGAPAAGRRGSRKDHRDGSGFLGAVPPIGTPAMALNARRSQGSHTLHPPSQSGPTHLDLMDSPCPCSTQIKIVVGCYKKEGPRPNLRCLLFWTASHVANKFGQRKKRRVCRRKKRRLHGGRRSSAEHSNVARYGYIEMDFLEQELLHTEQSIIVNAMKQSAIGYVARSSLLSKGVSLFASFIGSLQASVTRSIVKRFLGSSWSAAAIDAGCSHLLQLHEEPDWNFIRAKQDQIAFWFGVDDHWGPLTHLEEISRHAPGVALSIEKEGHTHGYQAGGGWILRLSITP